MCTKSTLEHKNVSKTLLKIENYRFKGQLYCLGQFLAAESYLKMMKNAFYFILKALFIPKIFKFLFCLFGHVGKQLDKKVKDNFKIHDVTNW